MGLFDEYAGCFSLYIGFVGFTSLLAFMKLHTVLLACVAFMLQACSGLNSAVGDAARAYYNSKNPPSYQQFDLKPGITYLEVRTPGNSALLVLAEVDQAAQPVANVSNVVETWVSSTREIIRTRAGFVTGSQGVEVLPHQIDLQFNAQGALQGLLLSQPNLGGHQVPVELNSVSVNTLKMGKSALLPRAQQVAGLVLQAWQGSSTVAGFGNSVHVVGTHPSTGRLVYGLHCFQPASCIEFLARTAEQNL